MSTTLEGLIAAESSRVSGRRKLIDAVFRWSCTGAALVASAILLVLVVKMVKEGAPRLSLQFLTSPPSMRNAQRAGILYPVLGSLWIMVLTVLFTVPVGIGAAVFLEEFYQKKTKFRDLIELNVSNLAGVPSIVYGMLGLGVFVGVFGLGKNILVGALTMSILVLPVVIMVTQEALKAVPHVHREASIAMGATQWETVWRIVLPIALPGILTGVILSAARAIGETAPLIVVGAVGLVTFPPRDVNSRYTVLPLQVLDWIQSPLPAFREIAAGAILVLVTSLFLLNGAAIAIRARSMRKV